MADSTQAALTQLQADVSTPKGLTSPQDQALLQQIGSANQAGDQAAQREAAARQLVTSSLTHMGAMIDPQLATEAIQSGATNDVASATQDPELAGILSGIPTGSGPAAGPMNGPNSTSAPNIDSFNWQNFWANDNKQQLKDNPQFEALGEVPQMNVAYLQGVMNADPNSTRKWQHWLADSGMYADSSGKPEAASKVSLSGKWGQADKAALSSYMISLFTPDALWSKDPQRQAQAQTFLSRLGFDAQKFWTDQGRSATTQTGIVADWMTAQGSGGKQGDALKRFADNYGPSNLPDGYRKVYEGVANPSVWDDVLGTVSTVTKATSITNVGQLLASLTGLSKNYQDPNDPSVRKRNDLANSLNASDRAALTPALTEIANSTGILPMEWYDQNKTRALMTAVYYTGGTSHGGSANPFDDWRLAGQAVAGQSSPTALLMNQFLGPGKGDQWMKDHPTAAGITDFAINSIDDPLTYLAPDTVGRLGLRGASAVGVRSLLSDSAKATLDRVVDPRAELERSMVPQIQAVQAMGEGGSRQNMERLLGITDDQLANPIVAKRYEPVLQQLLAEKNPTVIRGLLNDHFRHDFLTGRGYLQWQQGVKALTPEVAKKMDADFVTRVRTMGGMKDTGLSMTVDKPHETANAIESGMHILGMPAEDITKSINEFRSLPAKQRQFWVDSKLVKLMDDSPAGKKVLAETGRSLSQETRDFRDMMMRGTQFGNAADGESLIGPYQRVSEHSYAPKQPEPGKGLQNTPDLAQETSTAKIRTDPTTERTIAKIDETMRALQDSFAKHVDGAIDKLRAGDPGLSIDAAKATALADDTIVKLKAEMDSMLATAKDQAQQLTGGVPTVRGAPMFTSQLRQTMHMPVDNYTLYAYLNPVVRKAEQFQSKFRADAIMSTWKSLALAQPSTGLRIMLGDDLSRFVIQLAMDGHPMVAAKAALWGTGKGIAAAGATSTRSVLTAVAKAAGKGKAAKHLSDGESHLVKNAVAYLEENGFRDRITLAKQIGDADLSEYIPYAPGAPGYQEALQRGFHMWTNAGELQQWAKNMRLGGESQAHSGLLDTYVNHSKDPILKARLDELVGIHADRADVAASLRKIGKVIKKPLPGSKARAVLDAQTKWATTVHDYMMTAFRHPTVTQWLEDGEINPDQFAKLYKQNPEVFPVTPSPRLNPAGGNVFNSMSKGLTNLGRASFNNIAQPMIEVSRAEGARLLQQQYAKHIAKTYGSEMSQEEVDAISSAKAISWMRQSLYTGQRTLMGRALRTVVPFNGATSNMARFYVKMAREHPHIVMPGIRAGLGLEGSASHPTTDTTGFGGIMGKLGFAGGSALQYNPAHAFFFSSDGIASFIPGLGPIFSPLTAWANQNQGIIDEINTIPGLREQFQFTSTPGAHPVVPWLQKILDGAGLLSPLHTPITQGIPLIGSDPNVNKRNLDTKARQLEADYLSGKRSTEPSASDVASAQGSAMLAGEAVGAALPITPRVVDEKAQQISAGTKAFDAATTNKERDAVLAQYPDVAPVLRYFDPRTTLQQRDALASSPKTNWIAPYVSTIYSTTGVKPVTLSEFDQAVQTGNEQLLGTGEFIPNVRQYVANESSWTTYNTLRNAEQQYMTDYGVTSQDPDYKAWVAANIAPRIAKLQADNTTWADQFIKMKSTSQPGLTASTRPIRDLMTWEVIPQNAALENDRSVAWRRAMTRIDEAGAALNELSAANGGSAADRQDVLDQLNVYLQAYAQTSPSFAADLAHYRTTDFEDVAKLEAGNISAANAS